MLFLSLGGEYRARLESFTNQNYSSEHDSYYSQRLDLHGSLHLGKRVRFFGELYHGLTSGPNRFLEDETLDLHQGFLEVILHEDDLSTFSIRGGRQEIGYGISRLVGIREGPNMRRSFDLIKLDYQWKKRSVNILYGKELTYGFEAFDNESQFFQEDGLSPFLWGIYIKENTVGRIGNFDFYYFGFHSNASILNDISGQETRHSLGIRSYGNFRRFSYNTELIYQFGKLGSATINAYNFETDWKLMLVSGGWKPTMGLRLDFSSGDRRINDNQVQTFNPLFVNPAIYSLAGVNTPSNLTSLHPNLTIYPTSEFSIYLDFAIFFRTRSQDALYTPPRFILREANNHEERHIGNVLGFQAQYEINRNISIDFRSSYFITGRFIEVSGASKNTFYIAPTMSFKI